MSKALVTSDPVPPVDSFTTWASAWPNTTFGYFPSPVEKYANEVEIEEGDYDATLRFYRKQSKGTSRSLVCEVVVPLGVLGCMTKKPKAKASKR